MKSVIIDITHIPHINLFKNVVSMLEEKGISVDIICLDRGKNYVIAKDEFPTKKIHKIGKYRSKYYSIYLEAYLLRFFKIISFLYPRRYYNIGVSAGSFILGFALQILGIPNIQIQDDIESKKRVILQTMTSAGLFYPPFTNLNPKIKTFNALKEWAYLSPQYFRSDESILLDYNLEKNKYIFVRDVTITTLNYRGQDDDILLNVASGFPEEYKVILSLEDKSKSNYYPKKWLILDEPVKKIHSLMFYSKVIVSSGDSMAREGAMLGVPTIYCGFRQMQANKMLIDKKMLFHVAPEEIIDFLYKINNGQIEILDQAEFRENLLNEWEDVNKFIINKIYEFGRE